MAKRNYNLERELEFARGVATVGGALAFIGLSLASVDGVSSGYDFPWWSWLGVVVLGTIAVVFTLTSGCLLIGVLNAAISKAILTIRDAIRTDRKEQM